MKSIFSGLAAAVLALSLGGASLAQQQVELANDPAAKKAVEARGKQLEAVAKGERRAVEAEAKLKTQTAALAPTIVSQAKIPCTPTDSVNRASWNNNNLVELACSEGIGYLVFVGPNAANIQARECIPDAKSPLITACSLPANANPAKGLQPYLVKAGSDCVIEKATHLAASPTLAAYEVACASGLGQMLTITLPRSDASRPTAAPCLAIATLLPALTCTLTSAEANMAPVRALAAKSEKACPLKDQRFVGSLSNGSEYYEYACQDGSGFMIQASAKGAYERTLNCVQASNVAGGCKLSNAAAAIAAQNTTYSSMLKSAGFDCQVSKFATFPPKAGATFEALEFGCSNRPESIIGLVTGNKAELMNCARAPLDGFRCSYSKPEDSYKLVTDNLKQIGKATCDVNGARVMGVGSRAVYLEVSCSDGAPGFVVSYPVGAGKPIEATVCGQATNLGGGCQMPANKKT